MVGRGEKSLLSDPGSESLYARMEREKEGGDAEWDEERKKKNPALDTPASPTLQTGGAVAVQQ